MISHYIIVSVGIKYLCVTYFLSSITMPDVQNSDMRHMMSALYLASARLSNL